VVRDARQGIRHRRDAVREGSRAKRRFSDWATVQLQPDISRKRPIVRRREFHEQIVRVLPIVNCCASAHLTTRRKVGVAAATNRPGLEADHSAEAKVARPKISIRHAHEPVDAAALIAAPVATLVQILQEGIPVRHQRPFAGLAVDGVHRRLVWKPRRARTFARWRHRHVLLIAHVHVLRVVLLGGVAVRWRTLRLMLMLRRRGWRRCRGTNRHHTANGKRQRSNENR
jgi:hypothetical protein